MTWSGWRSVGGATSDSPSISAVNGMLHLVVRGTDNRVYYNRYDVQNALWLGYSSLGGATSHKPAIVSYTFEGSTILDVVVTGTDSHPYHKHWDAASGWTSWMAIDGTTNGNPVLLYCQSSVWLGVMGADNGIYITKYDGNSWSSWQKQPGSTNSTPSLVSMDDQLRIAVRGLDNGIYTKIPQ
jgi:hypothetical protein